MLRGEMLKGLNKSIEANKLKNKSEQKLQQFKHWKIHLSQEDVQKY